MQQKLRKEGSSMKISYGLTKSIEGISTEQYPTAGSILASNDLRSILGFPEGCVCSVDGIEVENNTMLDEGDDVMIIVRANKKG